jgi:methyl coenzyme M reductase alpha subunit
MSYDNNEQFTAVIAVGIGGVHAIIGVEPSSGLGFDFETGALNVQETVDGWIFGRDLKCGVYEVSGVYSWDNKDENGQSFSEFNVLSVEPTQ